MAYEQKDFSGALFKNDKGGNERRPDYRGDAKIAGVMLEISAWIKEGNKGKWMSLSFKVKDAERQIAAAEQKERKAEPDPEFDDIPFN